MASQDNIDVVVNVGADISEAEKQTNKLAEKLKKKVKEINEEFKLVGYSKSLERKLANVRATAKANKISLRSGTTLWNKMESSKQIEETTKKEEAEDKNNKKNKSTTNIMKLFSTLKRVGFYRIARNFFRMFESGISEGLKSLSNISPEANETLSKMSGNLTTIGNSLSAAILPVLKIVQPILQVITDTVAHLAEGFSYLAYKLGLTSSWFKINTKYMKEFNQQTNKLSFDKFEALSGEDNSSEMLTEMTEDDTSGEVSSYAIAMSSILTTLTAIGSLELITWIKNDGVKKLKEGLDKVKTSVSNISNATMILSSALGFITSVTNLINLINNWNTSSLISKILGITAAVIGLASVVMTILALTGVGSAKVMKAVATGLGAGAALLAGASALTVSMKADGGMVEAGSLFIAGEAGAELVTTNSSGQTGVTNIAQFKQAMLEALYEWSDSTSGGSDVVLELDGAEIARSKRYIGEMNRRNSGLNLR